MQWLIHPDGSFDLTGPGPTFANAYPSFDGQPLRPVQIEIEPLVNGAGTIRYTLADGHITILLGRDGERLTLATELSLPGPAPVRVSPVGAALIEDATQFFRQGLGMGDESKFHKIPTREQLPSSLAVSALTNGDDQALVIAPLDHRRFLQETDVYTIRHDEQMYLNVSFKTEGIPSTGAPLNLPPLHFAAAATPWEGLRGMAVAIGAFMEARTDKPQPYHWCSWYYLYYHLDEEQLADYLKGFQQLPDDAKPQTVQIDAGYFPHVGDWLETSFRFPSGMEAAFNQIRESGFRAGIWIAPFMVGSRSRLFQEHPDWMLRGADGELVKEWINYYEGRVWGYQDEETYVLDSSHPDAMDYLRQVFCTYRGWGVDYFKTDFLLWGFKDSSTVQRHTLGKTSQEYLREVLQMIREEIGEDSYWLACIAPFAALIGYADGFRTAGDVAADWRCCQNMLTQTIGCQYLNNVWYQNDPDAIILRRIHNHMEDKEASSLALWMGMPGGIVNTSCPIHELPEDRLALWRFLKPGPEKWTAALPCFGRDFPLHTMVRHFQSLDAWAVLILNPQEHTVMKRLPLADLVGRGDIPSYEWGPETCKALGLRAELLVELEAHECRLFYVGNQAPPAGLTLGGAVPKPTRRA